MRELLADLRAAFRSLLATRATTAAAILTIALGTGGNTAVLAVAYGVSKTDAVYSAIRGDIVHGLVTHASLARALLSRAGRGTSGR